MAKRVLAIVVATAAAAFSAQAWAGDGVTGYVKIGGAFGNVGNSGPSTSLSVATVDGAFQLPLYGMGFLPRTYWSVSANGGVANLNEGGTSFNVVNATGHFTYNNYVSGPGGMPVAGWRGGAYGGLVDLSPEGKIWTGGIEGQMLVTPNLQIEARAGIYTGDGESLSHFYVGGNFFPVPTLKVNAHGFVTTAGTGLDVSGLGAGMEYMPAGSRLSFFGTLDSVQFNGNTATAGRVGITVPLGGNAGLFNQAVTGATLGNGLVIGILPVL